MAALQDGHCSPFRVSSRYHSFPFSYYFYIYYSSIVPIGEASVIIAASSEHRQAAMEAVVFAITSVKESAAIWKKV